MLLALIATSAVVIANNNSNEVNTREYSNSSQYKPERLVPIFIVYPRGNTQNTTMHLYRGENTCDAYYIGPEKYIVHKNEYQSYKDHDVSTYRYIAYGNAGAFWFFNF